MYFFNIIYSSEKKSTRKVSKVLEKKRHHQYAENDYNILT